MVCVLLFSHTHLGFHLAHVCRQCADLSAQNPDEMPAAHAAQYDDHGGDTRDSGTPSGSDDKSGSPTGKDDKSGSPSGKDDKGGDDGSSGSGSGKDKDKDKDKGKGKGGGKD